MGRGHQTELVAASRRQPQTAVGYDPVAIESSWQQLWEEEKTWHAGEPEGEKSYVLEMLPYPSGEPHLGHMRCYAIGDTIAHYERLQGKSVLHPMGYDAFGLPAENKAIDLGIHPRESTEASIAEFARQFRQWGISIDWSREIATYQPEYYQQTQRLFQRLFDAGLAYQKAALVNWCPGCQTVLANEQAKGGKCERCSSSVEQREMTQWYFKITDYAERLIDDLDKVDWPEKVKVMQRNWIGRSEGATVSFTGADGELEVFTTRPETLPGVTFIALAPEHPWVQARLADPELRAYVQAALNADPEARGANTVKTGLPLGLEMTNPITGEQVPVYVADYVLPDYGSGAVMGVPAHDERDYEFAQVMDLPIVRVFEGGELPYSGHGEMVADGFSGDSAAAQAEIIKRLEADGRGQATVSYKLRDWGISRQRYWGCPIPIVHCGDCGTVPVPDEQLPVELPEVTDYQPKGQSPLAAVSDWVHTDCPNCDKPARRETDTMDTFVDSSWYYMRYTDPENNSNPFDPETSNQWLPVDHYIGGIEHAVLHLMYARFFTKALHDQGLVEAEEPFKNLFTQGMIIRDGEKMAKSRGNTLSPRQFVEKYGADATRVGILALGPPEADADIDPPTKDGVKQKESAEKVTQAAHRFLTRLHRLSHEIDAEAKEASGTGELRLKTHQTIARVSRDLGERRAFNTAVSAVIELVNDCYRHKDELSKTPAGQAELKEAATAASQLIFPMAPHLGAECYQRLQKERVWTAGWPTADDRLLATQTVEIPVMVDNKIKDKLQLPSSVTKDAQEQAARQSSKIQQALSGRTVVKVIVVPGRMVNFATKA